MPHSRLLWSLLFLLAGEGFALAAHAQQLIVNQAAAGVPIYRNDVRALFTMRLRQWPDGTGVHVFVLPDHHPLHRQFSRRLGVLPRQLRRAWDRAVFSGTGQAPTEVSDEAEMLERVRNTPGAVGYVSDGVTDEGVRFVPVE